MRHVSAASSAASLTLVAIVSSLLAFIAIPLAARPARADDLTADADAILEQGRLPAIDTALALDAPVRCASHTVAADPPPSPTPAASAINDDTNLHLLFGSTWANSQNTLALEVTFEKRLTDYFSIEGLYDNEGHINDHHRDAVALQLFAQRRVLSDRVRLRIGLGPLLYFDTKTTDNADGSTDAHGIGLFGTLAAEVDLIHGVFAEVRANGSLTQNDFSSGQVLLGLGYHLGTPDRTATEADRRRNTIFLLGGQSIRNSFHSERGSAVMAGIEREEIVSFVGASASYLRLGSFNGRQGMAVELTAAQRFFDRRLSLGAALGPFLYGDTTNAGHKEIGFAGLVGVKVGWEVIPAVDLLVSLMREFGNKDYDLLLAGLGFRF